MPPTQEPSSTPAVSPSPAASPLAGGWIETFSRELFTLGDIVAGPAGLIAPGCEADVNGTCTRAVLLTSADGLAWTELALEGAADASVRSVARAGDRLFALGERRDDVGFHLAPAVWASLDGKSWSRVSLESSVDLLITEVIDAPGGALAIGIHWPMDSEGSGFVVWDVAPDGSFGKPRDAGPDGGLEFVQGAIWADGRFLAWRARWTGAADEQVRSTVFMTSPDGKAWKVLPDIAAFRGATVVDVLDVGAQLVAVGYEGAFWPASPRAWTSIDARAWEASDVSTSLGAMYTVAIEDSGLVARGVVPAGAELDASATWTSPDGGAWSRLPTGEDMPEVPGFRTLARGVINGRACVAGTFYEAPTRPAPSAAIYCR